MNSLETQRCGVDYVETYAPVVRYESIRILLALAAAEDLEMQQFDVKTAFLYGDLKDDIWIELLEGPWPKDKRIVKLNKSLYGLKQSPHCWNEKFNNVLEEFQLEKSEADECIYIGKYENEMIYLALYVDDGLVFSKSIKIIDRFLQKLGQVFEIKVSEPNYFVGLEIERDRSNRLLKIHQKSYIERIIEKFGMTDAKTVSIPVDPNTRFSNAMSPKTDKEREEMVKIPYSALIGSLQFAVNVTRLDIAFGVNLLSRYLQNPGREHWLAAKRILKYLKATTNLGMIYGGRFSSCEPICYSDVDFAGDEDERRSMSGNVVMLCGGPVTWMFRRQRTVSLSTAEAELIAAITAIQEVMWILKLMTSILKLDETQLKSIQLRQSSNNCLN